MGTHEAKRHVADHDHLGAASRGSANAPGKEVRVPTPVAMTTPTVQLAATTAREASMSAWHLDDGLLSAMGLSSPRPAPQAVAATGVSGHGGALPHQDAIQRSFGHHDVSAIKAHTDDAAERACLALGAQGYATGSQVAFAQAPGLHTAAHEAAHVVQQRAGLQLKGGLSERGDAHEQHADAVADAVVQGRSAQPLLDQVVHVGATSGSPATAPVQRLESRNKAGKSHQAGVELPPAIAEAIRKLSELEPLTSSGAAEHALELTALNDWLGRFTSHLTEAMTASTGAPEDAPAALSELTQAVERCVQAHAEAVQRVAAQIPRATAALMRSSSVTSSSPAPVSLPPQSHAQLLREFGAQLNLLSRDAALPATSASTATLRATASAVQDASLAVLQALSVQQARGLWSLGAATTTPSVDEAGTGPLTELDALFRHIEDFGVRVSVGEDPTTHERFVRDWCGFFVASMQMRGAGLAFELRSGFHHVDNLKDFFRYRREYNRRRAPASIWAEDRWWSLRDYHQARGSVRQWTSRDDLAAALRAGTEDLRPGDTCLIDHVDDRVDGPMHIVMIESYDPATRQLVTIEGNTHGIHVDAEGKAERVDDEHLKQSKRRTGTSAGIQVRDLEQIAPGPGSYLVKSDVPVRSADDPRVFRSDGASRVVLPKNLAVQVIEVKDLELPGAQRHALVADWGWVKMTALKRDTPPAPAGAYVPRPGITVWAVGRPSAVDFEQDHYYAEQPVPEALRAMSPEQIQSAAKAPSSQKLSKLDQQELQQLHILQHDPTPDKPGKPARP